MPYLNMTDNSGEFSDPSYQEMADWIRHCTLLSSMSTSYGDADSTREAFWRALLLGCDSEARILEPDFKQHFEMWQETLFIASEVFQQSTERDEDPKRREAFTASRSNVTWLRIFSSLQ
jgi:hypothetical protein